MSQWLTRNDENERLSFRAGCYCVARAERGISFKSRGFATLNSSLAISAGGESDLMLLWVFLAMSLVLLSYWGVAVVRRWIVQWGMLDIPNVRSSHHQATPRGGGLVVVVITLAAWFIYGLLNGSTGIAWWLPWVGALVVAVTGWIDDINSLPSKLRLGIHTFVAVLGMIGFGVWDSLSFLPVGRIPFGWLSYPLTLLWIVGLINAYNFMDGIDGLAGSQAVIAGGGWFFLGLLWGHNLMAILGLTLAATSFGFLLHNWHPASIFMGDVASGFMGYMFAVLPLIGKADNARAVTLIPGILLVWPFLFDTILTFLRRLRNNENVFAAHRSHLYQRLIISGMRHQAVTLLYMVLAFLGLMCIMVAQWQPMAYVIVVFVLLFCGIWLILFVRKRERTSKREG